MLVGTVYSEDAVEAEHDWVGIAYGGNDYLLSPVQGMADHASSACGCPQEPSRARVSLSAGTRRSTNPFGAHTDPSSTRTRPRSPRSCRRIGCGTEVFGVFRILGPLVRV